ncbi:MAG: hypothetical protein B7Z29_02075 [Hyphomicrobium sp. 12-62-95]|nr:MAG: hypothetical protein B7Z29_02075 [Hyphomicrobium sp. 12-62-95]
MGSIQAQLEAIRDVPIGDVVLAMAAGFVGIALGLAKHIVEQRAQRRAMLRDMADRMAGRGYE